MAYFTPSADPVSVCCVGIHTFVSSRLRELTPSFSVKTQKMAVFSAFFLNSFAIRRGHSSRGKKAQKLNLQTNTRKHLSSKGPVSMHHLSFLKSVFAV